MKKRFWYDFTSQQRDMIEAIREAILNGGDQAIAASRGEGKTSIFERTLLKYVLSGAASFAVLFASTGSNAEDSLNNIKNTLETGERLRADYPEVCVPVYGPGEHAEPGPLSGRERPAARQQRSLTGWPPSRFSWCGREIVLPPGSRFAVSRRHHRRGLNAAVRGTQ